MYSVYILNKNVVSAKVHNGNDDQVLHSQSPLFYALQSENCLAFIICPEIMLILRCIACRNVFGYKYVKPTIKNLFPSFPL